MKKLLISLGLMILGSVPLRAIGPFIGYVQISTGPGVKQVGGFNVGHSTVTQLCFDDNSCQSSAGGGGSTALTAQAVAFGSPTNTISGSSTTFNWYSSSNTLTLGSTSTLAGNAGPGSIGNDGQNGAPKLVIHGGQSTDVGGGNTLSLRFGLQNFQFDGNVNEPFIGTQWNNFNEAGNTLWSLGSINKEAFRWDIGNDSVMSFGAQNGQTGGSGAGYEFTFGSTGGFTSHISNADFYFRDSAQTTRDMIYLAGNQAGAGDSGRAFVYNGKVSTFVHTDLFQIDNGGGMFASSYSTFAFVSVSSGATMNNAPLTLSGTNATLNYKSIGANGVLDLECGNGDTVNCGYFLHSAINGNAIQGVSSNINQGIGVLGTSAGTGLGAFGVEGQNTGAGGAGVAGIVTVSTAVYGSATSGLGAYFTSNSGTAIQTLGGNIGVQSTKLGGGVTAAAISATVDISTAVYGTATSSGTGGYFTSTLGNALVTGTGNIKLGGQLISSSSATLTAISLTGGHYNNRSTAPGLSSCGATPSIVGSDNGGTITLGTGSPTGCTVTFNSAWTNAPFCIAQTTSTATTAAVNSQSASQFTIVTSFTVPSLSINYVCIGRD